MHVDTLHPVATSYLDSVACAVRLVSPEALDQAIELVLAARATNHRIYIIGNGGSSATASHFVCDLVKTAHARNTVPVRAFALTDSVPLLTAWANDRAYESIFAEQINALVDANDVLIAISASGRSANIVAGVRAAAKQGARTIGMLGFDGGLVRDLVDVAIHVPSADYGVVEDVHAAVAHAIAGAVRLAAVSAQAMVNVCER